MAVLIRGEYGGCVVYAEAGADAVEYKHKNKRAGFLRYRI